MPKAHSLLGTQCTKDGALCRINVSDESGEPASITFAVEDIPRLVAGLANEMKRAIEIRGGDDLPYFPAQAMKVALSNDATAALVSFVVPPAVDLTFLVDGPSLQGAIHDLVKVADQIKRDRPRPN